MKRYPLAAIHALRVRKEDEALRKLAAARIAEKQARDKMHQAEKALNDYLIWMTKEAEHLFETILGGSHRIHKVTEVTNEIAWNRSQQAVYVVALDGARDRLHEAESYTAECLKEQEIAYKNVWKLDRHREVWMQEETARQEYEEESDLEEVASTIFSRH